MTTPDPDAYRAALEREIKELRKQFAAGLVGDIEPGAADRLDAIRRRIAEVKRSLSGLESE